MTVFVDNECLLLVNLAGYECGFAGNGCEVVLLVTDVMLLAMNALVISYLVTAVIESRYC